MFLELFSFLVGFILLLLVFIIFFKQKNDRKLNIFFLTLITIAGLHRFVFGLDYFGLVNIDYNVSDTNLKFTFFLPPLYYAFFWSLLRKRLSFKRLFTLLGIAVIIVMVLYFFELSRDAKQIIFLCYSSIYLLQIIALNKKYLFNQKTLHRIHHVKLIKTWALIMLGMYLLIYIFSNYTFSNYLFDSSDVVLKRFFINTSLLWFAIALYILLNPLILYGEQLLQKELISQHLDEIPVWSKKKLLPTSSADKLVEQKFTPNLNSFFIELKNYEDQLFKSFNKVPTLKGLSIELDYPQSHIKYIFKYYSHYSFSEYLNVLKVRYAITLIKSDYLSTHTLEALSNKALFTNRSTFFKNFKSLTGYSPSNFNQKTQK